MVSKFNLTYMDNTLEKSVASFQGVDMTAVNFDAQVALQNAITAAVAGINNGVVIQTNRIAVVTDATPAAPAVGVQREIKFMARWHAGAELHRTEIPCADLSVMISGSEIVDLTAGAGLAFKTAFEAYVVGDDGATAAVLDSLTFVTRNT